MKDCLERKSWGDWDSAHAHIWDAGEHAIIERHVFFCHRCCRFHAEWSQTEAEKAQKALRMERCVSTRELHLQMARVAGVSLEELDVRFDLSKISINGPGMEFVGPRNTPV